MTDLLPPSVLSPPTGGMPYAGIATFAGYPLWQSGQNPDAVVLGIPYDEGVTYRPGARFGPRAVRDASMFYNYEGMDGRFYDADRRRWILKNKVIADAGDVDIEPLVRERNWEAITDSVKAILNANAIPAIIGGDHSVTHPVVQAFAGRKFHYVHFDTHVDCDRLFESQHTHGSPVAHIIDEETVQSVTMLGVRGLTNSGDDIAWIQKKGARIITARELKDELRKPNTDLFPKGDYYLSLDIDFFDPSAAPGTGTPEPGGLFFPEFSDVIHSIANCGNIIGFDVVEVNPLLDGPSGITSHLAARCILEMMSAACDGKSP